MVANEAKSTVVMNIQFGGKSCHQIAVSSKNFKEIVLKKVA
jgi:hypothetical protein